MSLLSKMIVTGAKLITESINAAKKYVQIINRVGFPEARFVASNYKIQNMTATCDFGFPIRLEGLIYAHSALSTYEPELFPGLIYRMVDPKVTLLIFVSGKVVVTGAKTEESLQQAIENIFPILLDFRKRTVIVST
jgi:transcription initiation factor TFIID TATA-box-binding protein